MIPIDLATYTENQIEELARKTLRDRPDVEQAAPMNIEWLVEGLPNFAGLVISDGLKQRHNVEGMVLKYLDGHRELEVRIDRSVYKGPWHQYSRALCEEFAHIVIHPSLFLHVNSEQDFVALQRHPQWHKHEEDARRFGDAVAMPRDLIASECERIYPSIVDEYGFEDTLSVFSLLIGKLAVRFRVHNSDVRRRLQQKQVGMEDRVLSSLQSRSLTVIPEKWSVEPRPQAAQPNLFEMPEIERGN